MDNITKKAIVDAYLISGNKTEVGKKFGVSPRTVYRCVKSMGVDDAKPTPSFEEKAVTNAVPAAYRYFVVSDDSMISVTRVSLTGTEPPHSEIAFAGTVRYDEAMELASQGKNEEAYFAISKKAMIEKLTKGKVTAYPELGVLEYDDGVNRFSFPADLATRIIEQIQNDKPVDNLLNFANRLANNPSSRAVNELFGFLMASDIQIAEDGRVLCYKKVRDNYRDVHSNTFDNSVGQVVSMPRHMVDDDSSRTCSTGLHLASKHYLQYFGGERVMLCAVDPADVVSIPDDYYSMDGETVTAKMRCCKYEVIAELDPDQI